MESQLRFINILLLSTYNIFVQEGKIPFQLINLLILFLLWNVNLECKRVHHMSLFKLLYIHCDHCSLSFMDNFIC